MGRRGAVIAAALVGLMFVALPARAESGYGLPMHVGLGPDRLPPRHPAPVVLQIGSKFVTAPTSPQPTTTELKFEFGPSVIISDQGLPSCGPRDIRAIGLAEARRRCATALVGEGNMSFADFSPGTDAPVGHDHARLLLFNHDEGGRPGLLGQMELHGSGVTVPFAGSKRSGTGGNSLVARLPGAIAGPGRRLVAFDLSVWGGHGLAGHRRSFLSASCPIPPGTIANRKVLTLSLEFADGTGIEETAEQACRATR